MECGKPLLSLFSRDVEFEDGGAVYAERFYFNCIPGVVVSAHIGGDPRWTNGVASNDSGSGVQWDGVDGRDVGDNDVPDFQVSRLYFSSEVCS